VLVFPLLFPPTWHMNQIGFLVSLIRPCHHSNFTRQLYHQEHISLEGFITHQIYHEHTSAEGSISLQLSPRAHIFKRFQSSPTITKSTYLQKVPLLTNFHQEHTFSEGSITHQLSPRAYIVRRFHYSLLP
jgi:hypothetical protein